MLRTLVILAAGVFSASSPSQPRIAVACSTCDANDVTQATSRLRTFGIPVYVVDARRGAIFRVTFDENVARKTAADADADAKAVADSAFSALSKARMFAVPASVAKAPEQFRSNANVRGQVLAAYDQAIGRDFAELSGAMRSGLSGAFGAFGLDQKIPTTFHFENGQEVSLVVELGVETETFEIGYIDWNYVDSQ